MTRYLVEIPHPDNPSACDQAVKLLLERGSHLITHVDIGCKDGVHKAWIIIEAETKNEVRIMLPPVYRPDASITGLTKFSLEDMTQLSKLHE